jgi:hypothetical protein
LDEEDSSDCDDSEAETLPPQPRCNDSFVKPPVDSASRPTVFGASFFQQNAFGMFLRDAGKICNQNWYWLAVWYLRVQVLMAASALLWGATNAAILYTQGAASSAGQSFGALAVREAMGRYFGLQRITAPDSFVTTLSTTARKPWTVLNFSDCLQVAVSCYYTLGQYLL